MYNVSVLLYIGTLLQGNQMQPVARIDGNFNFEYVGNNSNETVWPGTCISITQV